jgi:hypothetical protein
MDLLQRHLHILLRESHDPADTSSANAVDDEDRPARLDPTHARVMRCLLAEQNRHAGRKRLISREESR